MEKTKVTLPNRYPGTHPFERDQKRIFFGRDQDKTNLFRTISVNDLTVLYGESGLGKSSLLNAGVLPEFIVQGVTAIPLRFYAYNKDNPVNPLQNILGQLRPFALDETKGATESIFMNAVQSDPAKQSLWQQVKSILWRLREGRTGLILVLDQFEEIFTYPKALIEEFGREFGELLDNRMPESFRQRFYDMLEHGAQEPGTPEELAFLEKSPPLKVVLGIRFDKLGLLKSIAQFYPNILLNQNLFRLLPLTRDQAREAIERPASEAGDFSTPQFTYSEGALKSILDYLTDDNTKSVETTQLQVICQYVEKTIIKPKVEGQIVQAGQLGDIRLIFQNYYDNIIASLPESEQPKVRNMVENGLIFEPELRLSLYGEQIEKLYGVLPETLEVLVGKHHLLRVEERSGGFVYEISHDSLVPPILKSKNEREAERARIEREAEEARLLAEAEEKARIEREAREEQERLDRAARAEKERQERLRRQNIANFRFAVVTGTLFLAALVFAIIAYYQSAQARDARKEAEQKAQEAQEQRMIAEQKKMEAQTERDSAVALRARLSSETYSSWYNQGKLLMESKRYIDALPNFLEALKIDTPERNTAELKRLIDECRSFAGRETSYRKLMEEARLLSDQKKYLEAYPKYQQALALNFDNAIVQLGMRSCEGELRNQLSDLLGKAQTFYDDGKSCKYASLTIQNYADPIIRVLQLSGKDELYLRRDKIWKKCPH